MFIHLNQWKSLFLSLSLVSSLPSGSRGICGETGELRGRQEMRLEPLKEVPYRGETSASQDWFSDGWLSECVCVSASARIHAYVWMHTGHLETCQRSTTECGWKRKKKKKHKKLQYKSNQMRTCVFSHLYRSANCYSICIYRLQPFLVGTCTSTPLACC